MDFGFNAVVYNFLTEGAGVRGTFQGQIDPNLGLSSNLLNPGSFPKSWPILPSL